MQIVLDLDAERLEQVVASGLLTLSDFRQLDGESHRRLHAMYLRLLKTRLACARGLAEAQQK